MVAEQGSKARLAGTGRRSVRVGGMQIWAVEVVYRGGERAREGERFVFEEKSRRSNEHLGGGARHGGSGGLVACVSATSRAGGAA